MNLEEFEKKTKKYLKERSIQPSQEHWKQLEAALDKNSKNHLSYYIWGSVAASIAVLFLLGKMYFTNATIPQTPENPQFENVVIAPSTVNKQQQNTLENPISDSLLSSREKDKAPALKNNKVLDNASQNQEVSIAKTDDKIKQQPLTSKAGSGQDSKFTQSKKEKVDSISTLAKKDAKPKVLSPEEEADILLREALYKEFLTHIKHEKDSVQIVAYGEELLKEANLNLEKEEDRAFRKKVKEVIQKNWDKAKSALVDASPYK